MELNGVRLSAGEHSVYVRAASRARQTYTKKHGGGAAVQRPASVTPDGDGWPEHVAAVHAAAETWRREHGDAIESAAYRAGCAAVKRTLTRYGQTDRIAELGLSSRARRPKKTAPEETAAPAAGEVHAVSIPDVAAASDGRVIIASVTAEPAPVPEETAPAMARPVSVPAIVATMPAWPESRGDRREWRRTLADRMRAAGIEPRGDAWRAAIDIAAGSEVTA